MVIICTKIYNCRNIIPHGMRGSHQGTPTRTSVYSGTSVKMDLATVTVEKMETVILQDHLFVNLSLVSTRVHFQLNFCVACHCIFCVRFLLVASMVKEDFFSHGKAFLFKSHMEQIPVKVYHFTDTTGYGKQ